MASGMGMAVQYLVLAIYVGGLILFGFRRKGAASVAVVSRQDTFFLSNRSLPGPALFFTLTATNFSAFTVLGLAGAGYRMGYSFYPAMAFGTGLMALGMYLIGLPMREEGIRRGWISSVDAVRDRYGALAAKVFAFFLVLFTLPYLALQPIAAGYLLQSIWGIPYQAGALGVAMLIALYTARGGLAGITRTDAFNGVLLFGIALAAWLGVRGKVGQIGQPQIVGGGRQGNPWEILGYYLLWFMADPLFPQMNQRFLAASRSSSLKGSVIAYPLITATLFFLTISTGVLGVSLLPGLSGADTDKIWLLAVGKAFLPVLSGIFALAPLAALVSTMDSQLLALSSIVARETGITVARDAKLKILVFLIAGIGAVLALFPPRDILAYLNKTSFLGYAVLFPMFFGVFYSRRAGRCGALASMLAGEAAVLVLGLGIPRIRTIPHIYLVAAVSILAWFGGNCYERLQRSAIQPRRAAVPKPEAPPQPTPGGAKEIEHPSLPVSGSSIRPRRLGKVLPLPWGIAFALLAGTTLDFFSGDRPVGAVGGYPLWLFWSAGATMALSILYAALFRNTSPGEN